MKKSLPKKPMPVQRSIGLNTLDANIVSLLQVDGRARNTDIAEQLGVTEGTVRNRIARMIDDGVIKFGLWADPIKIGFQTYVLIDIKVEPPLLEEVGQTLIEFPEIVFLGVCAGSFDLRASALFTSNEHMYEFITKHLNHVPGVVSTVTTSVLLILKRDFDYPVPHATITREGRTILSSDFAEVPLKDEPDGNGDGVDGETRQ